MYNDLMYFGLAISAPLTVISLLLVKVLVKR